MGCGTRLAIGFWIAVACYFVLLGLGHWLMLPTEVSPDRYMKEVVENYGLDMLKGAKARVADTQGFLSEFMAIRVDMTDSQRAELVVTLDASPDGEISRIMGSSLFMPIHDIHDPIDWWPEKNSVSGRSWDVPAKGKGYALDVFVPDNSSTAFLILTPKAFYIEP